MLIETKLPNLLRRGKVRDTYLLSSNLLLMVATDRLSAFDVVLPTAISDKGVILNRLSAFWFEKTRRLVPNHFLALADASGMADRFGDGEVLADLPPEIARRAMIVRRAERIDMECIVRGYLAGSAWSEYRRQRTVWGQPLPAGLLEGEVFPQPLFTPTTKAETGHDQNLTPGEVTDLVGQDLARELERVSLAVYRFGRDYAWERGLVLADTKMEFGLLDGQLILIDELLTPDSSRFWDRDGYQPGRPQPNFDKQYVRDWLTGQGWNQEPPAPALPEEVVANTAGRYREAYFRLTGMTLPQPD